MGQHISKSGSKSGVKRYKGGRLNPADILNERDMFEDPESFDADGRARQQVSEAMTVLQDMLTDYEKAGLNTGFMISELKPNSGVLGYYDGSNIAINQEYFNDAMNEAYQECVKMGFHPKSGSKSGTEAVLAHEFGHAINDAAARKLGLSLDQAATQIVNEARKGTKHRGVVQMAAAISTYATSSNAETIAEAVSDVYCNGKRATAESRAIVDVLRKYL